MCILIKFILKLLNCNTITINYFLPDIKINYYFKKIKLIKNISPYYSYFIYNNISQCECIGFSRQVSLTVWQLFLREKIYIFSVWNCCKTLSAYEIYKI